MKLKFPANNSKQFNFKLRTVIYIFLNIWRFEKRIALSEKQLPLPTLFCHRMFFKKDPLYANSNYFQVTAAAAGLSLLALGVYSAKRGTGVLASYVSARLGKPSLVRDTSRFSVFETLKHPINTIQKLRKSPQDALSGIVLEPGLESR